MEVVKDFLISTFFESALAFPWICVLWVAWRTSRRFVKCPVATTCLAVRRRAKRIHAREATMQVAMVFVLFSYPLGVVMQRVSDEFIEISSVWMPKTYKNGLKPIGRDADIKKDVWEKYQHLLAGDFEAANCNSKFKNDEEECLKEECTDEGLENEALKDCKKACLKEREKDVRKVVRDTRTRRAFGDEASGAYLNRLLELVRICQAAAMHLFLLLFVLLWLSLFLLGNTIERRSARTATFAVLLAILGIWTVWPAPVFHERGEFNVPVFSMFLLVDSWLIMIGWKIWQQGPPARIESRPSQIQLARAPIMAALIALALCYFATFSWSEHRENYEEAVLILGGEKPPEKPDAVASSQSREPGLCFGLATAVSS